MSSRVTFVLCSVFWAATASAAPLSGTVLDGDSLEPIPGATLVIDGTDLAAESDEQGRYRFEDAPPGAIVVRVAAEGYEPTDEQIELTEAGLSDRIIILLRPGTASETIEVVGKAPMIVRTPGQTKLDRQELVKLPGTRGDSMQVVKSLPGVANADAAGAGPGLLVIRGAAPEDSLFLLDGVQIPLVYHFFGLQSVIPSEFIDEIEFLPGGFGVEQGRATGGIVHIHTRPNRSLVWNGFAEMSFINVAGYLEGPLWKSQQLNVAAAFRRSTIDMILPVVIPDSANLSFTTAPRYYDGQLRIDWLPRDRHRVTVLALLSYDLLKLLSENENPNDPLATGTFFNETSFSRAMATWSYRSRAVESTAVASLGLGGFRLEIGADRFLGGDGTSVQLREDLLWRAAPRLSLRAGGDAQIQGGDFESKIPLPAQEGSPDMPNLTTDPVVEFDRYFTDHRAAAWLAADFKPVKQVTVTPGVRYDYYDRIGAHDVSPRLGAKYDITPRWRARLALGSYTRPLDQAEAVPTDLEPERATQYVLGAEREVSDSVLATSSVFYTDRRRLIVQEPALATEEDPLAAFINRGFGNSYGVEFLVRVKRDDLFGWIAYTLSRGTRVDGPDRPERLFDYDQTHNFIAVASWQWGKWTFGGRWQYTTGEPDTPIEGSIFLADFGTYVPVFGEVNSERLEDAHQLDVRIDRLWKFDTWQLSAYLDVTNVYAHARTLGYQYSFDYQEREAFTTLPIFPAVGVRGSF